MTNEKKNYLLAVERESRIDYYKVVKNALEIADRIRDPYSVLKGSEIVQEKREEWMASRNVLDSNGWGPLFSSAAETLLQEIRRLMK